MKLVELFCGTGAFSLAFSYCDLIYANDFDSSSKEIIKDNFDFDVDTRDLNEVPLSEIPKMDIITAGFPCQPFSIAGLRKGLKDKRANVINKIFEIIKHHKPRFAIFENVKNFKTYDDGNTFSWFKNEIEKIGYLMKDKVMNTSKYSNIPHHRERLFMVCFLNKKDHDLFEFPKEIELKTRMIDILEDNVDKKYEYTEKFKIWNTIKNEVTKNVDDEYVYQYRRTIVREKKKTFPCLTSNMGTGGHNVPIVKRDSKIRKLTPRECFRLQGFPDDYKLNLSDNKLYKLAGNAITVKLVERIANEIKKLEYISK